MGKGYKGVVGDGNVSWMLYGCGKCVIFYLFEYFWFLFFFVYELKSMLSMIYLGKRKKYIYLKDKFGFLWVGIYVFE